MAGFIQDPIAIINLISDNLRDRYSKFQVLKEIIQNADDAGKGNGKIHLEYGIINGLPGAEHPLLKGPALFFLNDGTFSDADEKAVRSFGLNQKADDKVSIGKFGLGMKSVFHFCEAFFFLAQDNNKSYAEILNPWSGNDGFESVHEDWEGFNKKDAELIENRLAQVFEKLKGSRESFFLIWLPLRKRKHLQVNGSEVGSIVSEFPGDDNRQLAFLRDEKLPQKLAALLPLLHSLESIRFWNELETGELESVFHIHLKNGSTRIKSFTEEIRNSPFSGSVEYSIGNDQPSLQLYHGRENCLDSEDLSSLKESDLWPKSYVRDEKGISREAPDKARPHCAVFFSRSPAVEKSELRLRWAVFLPVKAGEENILCKGDISFRLFLHGYFFVDAGRTDIDGLQKDSSSVSFTGQPQNEVELRRKWNIDLAKKGILPMILPALNDFVEETKLSKEDVENLSYALWKTKLFYENKTIICGSSQWVKTVNQSGYEWKLVPAKQKILPLPAPPQSAPERPWKTFKKLNETGETTTFIVTKASHLTLTMCPQWNESDLINLFDIGVAENFNDQGRLDYLLTFLDSDRVKPFLGLDSIQDKLLAILRQAFLKFAGGLNQHRKRVRDFVSFIDPQRRYVVKQTGSDVLFELQRCHTTCIVLSKDFDALKNPACATLLYDDSLQLLTCLHKLICKNETGGDQTVLETCRNIVREILQSLNDTERGRLFRGPGQSLKIIEVYDCSQAKHCAIPVEGIRACRDARRLFLFSQGTNSQERLGLALKYQKVIKDKVLLIRRDTAEMIFDAPVNLSSCNAGGVLDSLSEKIQLLSLESRHHLLSDLIGADLSYGQRVRGLRYILHGNTEKYWDSSDLWVSGYEQNPVWSKIWRQFAGDKKNSWKLLARDLIDEIPQNKWADLSIREIKAEELLSELRVQGMTEIQASQLTTEERNEILRHLDGDEELWKKLPLHETYSEKLVSITEKSYLKTEILLPDELYDCINIIKLSNDYTIRRQQLNWLSPLSKIEVIKTALQQSQAVKFWRLIMDNLENTEPDSDQIYLLRNTAWIPDIYHNPVKPSEVIYLKSLQDEVDRLLAITNGTIRSPGKLHKEVQNHPSFNLLKERFFATDRDGLEKFGLLLGKTQEYYVGKLEQGDDLTTIIPICSRITSNQGIPGWTLLSCASDAYSPDMVEENLLPEILKPVGKEKIIEMLKWLKNEYIRVSEKEKKNVLVAFNKYLSALVNERGIRKDLSRIHLLNREECWKPSKELCEDTQGVSESFLLDFDQRKILSTIIFSGDQHSENNAIKLDARIDGTKKSPENLKQYFASWDGLVADELICAFLALLGDDEGICSLAEQYKGRHSVAWIRDEIPWNRNDYWSMSKQKAFTYHKVVVKIHDDTIVKTYSILGDEIEIPVSRNINSLLVNNVFGITAGRYRISKFNLRKFNPEERTADELAKILKCSAEIILRGAFNQENHNLDLLWQELDKSEQLDIQIAQSLILDNIPFYLRQLGAHKHLSLQGLLHSWHDARCRQKEYSNVVDKKNKYEKEEKDILSKMRNLLTNDVDVQRKVLNSVRKKIGDFQYTSASIPFELFQNADDAMAELAEIKSFSKKSQGDSSDIIPNEVKRLLIINDGESMAFIHWGRTINSVGSAGFPGRERGFHYDLEKMLVLSSSDKPENNGVTGKFGLGFKSVLLASDRPKLISGRLSVEIIAGLCPMSLQASGGLRQKLHEHSPDKQYQGTLIEMPLTEATSQDVLGEFPELAGFMTVFARQIRQIDIHGKQSYFWKWAPDIIPLSETFSLEIGELNLSGSSGQKELLLYFKIDQSGILVALGPQGFRPLPDKLPTVWVVAPTGGKGPGFSVNGSFELDAGRSNLSCNSDTNREKADTLGRLFGKLLLKFYELTKDQVEWEVLKEKCRLEKDLSIYSFWSSLWNVLGAGLFFTGENEAVRQVIERIFAEKGGLGYLISYCDAMPNGLWGDYRALTRPKKVKVILKGCLGQEMVAKRMLDWEPLRNILMNPASVISEHTDKFAQKITPKLSQVTDQWRSVRIVDLLNDSLSSYGMSPDDAIILGEILNNENLKRPEFAKEKDQIIKVLRRLTFTSVAGSQQPSGKLLVAQKHSQANPDEARRAGFAPDKYILSDKYQRSALDFFFLCREKITIPVDEIPGWILDAPTDAKKKNGLRYLLEGEQAVFTGGVLRQQGRLQRTWLAGLSPVSEIVAGWSDDDKDCLFYRVLKSTEEIRRQFEFTGEDNYSYISNELRARDPKEVLLKIYNWWSGNRERYLTEYERKTYPANVPLDLGEDDIGRIDRKSWLVLFSLSHFHTIGRQRDVQHKGFIENCVSKGWWKVFSDEHPEEKSDEWMKVLEDYINEQVDDSEYELWMNRFPSIYKFARWLEDYKESFLSIERMDDWETITGVLKSKTNSQFQGGGVSAPPIERSLGIGACFTLRELKRKKVLNHDRVIPYCYVPTQKVRDLCSELGCRDIAENGGIDNSKRIHRFLCDHLGEQQATFSNCFDIPLQCLTRDNDRLLSEILN